MSEFACGVPVVAGADPMLPADEGDESAVADVAVGTNVAGADSGAGVVRGGVAGCCGLTVAGEVPGGEAGVSVLPVAGEDVALGEDMGSGTGVTGSPPLGADVGLHDCFASLYQYDCLISN